MEVARAAQFTGYLLEGIEADLLSTNAARNRQARSSQPKQQQ